MCAAALAKNPNAGMSAWKIPKVAPRIRAFLKLQLFCDIPAAMETAKASIDRASANSNVSARDIPGIIFTGGPNGNKKIFGSIECAVSAFA